MSSWYFINDNVSKSGPENMAVDEFLFNKAHREKVGFFRIYRWNIPTFSIGVSQKVEKVLDLNFVKSNKIGYVRRITGGKTVLHDDEITYSVVSSEKKFFIEHDLYKSYEMIANIIVRSLKTSGINAYLSSGSPTILSKSNNPCFSFPTPNEIEVNGKKIVGSAQKRDKTALLQHGSIPFGMNYQLYAKGAKFNKKILIENMTTIENETSVGKNEFILNFKSSFEKFLEESFKVYNFSDEDNDEIKRIQLKYESMDWNHAR